LLEEHILCVFICIYINKYTVYTYISRDIHHIVDTRVLKHTSTSITSNSHYYYFSWKSYYMHFPHPFKGQ